MTNSLSDAEKLANQIPPKSQLGLFARAIVQAVKDAGVAVPGYLESTSADVGATEDPEVTVETLKTAKAKKS